MAEQVAKDPRNVPAASDPRDDAENPATRPLGPSATPTSEPDPLGDVVLLEMYPEASLRAAYFEGVTNAAQLREALVAGSLPCDAALVDADRVVSFRVVRMAATNCARRRDNAKTGIEPVHRPNDVLRARNPSAELVYSLAASTSVGDALKEMGASASTTRLLVLAPDAAPEAVGKLLAEIKGERKALETLDAPRSAEKDAALVKYFKLSTHEAKRIEFAVMTRLATKDVKK
mmetsp:Transcript_14967/g.44701  ORF Transcript_14967/g.44701 Transcript_14967/m.44701 type:complete len:232 (-) Transcript_14967:4-699(-)